MAKRAARTSLYFWQRRRVLVAVALFSIALGVVASGDALGRAAGTAPMSAAGATGSAGPTGSSGPQSPPAVGSPVPSLWTASSRTFVGADGTMVAHVYEEPVNYQDSSGVWQPIDVTLVPGTDGGVSGVVNLTNRVQIALPSVLGTAPVEVSNGSSLVSFSLDGASGTGATSGATDVFAGALPGVDLKYTVENSGLKEDLVLAGPSSPRTFDFTVTASSGLTAVSGPGGSVRFIDSSGKTQLGFLPPVLKDAAGASAPGSLQMSQTAAGYHLTLDADTAWLDSPGRAWPVTVDPTVGDPSGFAGWPSSGPQFPTSDGYVVSGTNQNSNFFNLTYDRVGWDSCCVRRGLFKFNVAAALPAGSQILDAELNLYLTAEAGTANVPLGVYRATRASTTAATWNKYDGTHSWTSVGGDFSTEPQLGGSWGTASVGGALNTWHIWNVTPLVADWQEGTLTDYGMLLKAVSETTQANWLSFNSSRATGLQAPYVSVTYYQRAGQPSIDTMLHFPVSDGSDASVNAGNGNLDLCHTDLNLPGVAGFDLTLKRCMDSQEPVDAWPEFNNSQQVWFISPGQQTVLEPIGYNGELLYHGDQGDLEPFTPGSGSTYISPTGFNATLTATTGTVSHCNTTSPAYTATYADVLTFNADNSKRYFNSAGVLVAEADHSGNTICFYYNGPGGDLSSIVDTNNQTVTFHWVYTNSYGYELSYFTAPGNCAGGSCTYTYGYDPTTGYLNSFTDPTGTTRYAYSAGTPVPTSVKDANGNILTSFTYQSFAEGYQIASVTYPGQQPTSFSYGDTSDSFCSTPATKVTYPSTKAARYCFDGALRVSAIKGVAPTAGSAQITGTVQVGHTLTATPTGFNLGAPLATYSYQWEVATPQAPTNYHSISGATSATYVVPPNYYDDYLKVVITATIPSSSCTMNCTPPASATSAATSVVQGVPPAPGSVVITGTPQTGQTLTATASGFSLGTPAGQYVYTWYQCVNATDAPGSCTAVDRTSNSTSSNTDNYTVVASDVGNYIKVVATVSNTCASGCSPPASATSPPTGIGQGVAPTPGSVAITGTPQAGQALTATATGFTLGTPIGNYVYTWYRCANTTDTPGSGTCTTVDRTSGATSSTTDTYTMTGADVDHYIKVVATVSNTCASGCSPPASATSSATSLIQGVAPTAGSVAITGTAQAGQGLTATSSGFVLGSPTGQYVYTWYRCQNASDTPGSGTCTTVDRTSGATSSTTDSYPAVAGDINSYVKVVATVSNACVTGCSSVAATSSATSTIQGVAPTPGSVAVTGTPRSGQTLTATASGFTLGTPAGQYVYTWYQCASATDTPGSGNCTTVDRTSSSTSSTTDNYTVITADVGNYIKVVATLSNTCNSGCGPASATALFGGTGVGPTGDVGPTGAIGPADGLGSTGAAGSTGALGATGGIGPTSGFGPTGATGAVSSAGGPVLKGTRFLVSPVGSAGAQHKIGGTQAEVKGEIQRPDPKNCILYSSIVTNKNYNVQLEVGLARCGGQTGGLDKGNGNCTNHKNLFAFVEKSNNDIGFKCINEGSLIAVQAKHFYLLQVKETTSTSGKWKAKIGTTDTKQSLTGFNRNVDIDEWGEVTGILGQTKSNECNGAWQAGGWFQNWRRYQFGLAKPWVTVAEKKTYYSTPCSSGKTWSVGELLYAKGSGTTKATNSFSVGR